MKITLDDLAQKFQLLFTKVELIEQKLNSPSLRRKATLVSGFPIQELLSFKNELEQVYDKFAVLTPQALYLDIFDTLKQIETTTNEIKESTGFVKNIFVKEKVKPVKEKVPKQEIIDSFTIKYLKSMKK
ncbi:hypothetical protein OC25_03900 [Pedobacter kyungheensis]|uniref:Uncharacterized protein n=2 Tax=Pedobacter TaxID=84567 RepID=A0A1G6K4M5_9SPHI|nr:MULTISPECIES: hypothetical protein [Pedobacter]KIA96229.1 hypothetical protein OC25_03900 [Pedobacter kyungheensis]SDC25873.1 hypothetical protein SAMN04488024_101654 [Pedobacter soli]